MDPKTGAILAMASRPASSSPSCRSRTRDLDLYRNRAVTDLYEPGSVIKTITMATAIDLGLVTPNTTYYDSGTVTRVVTTFKNWDFSANGIQTMTQVLQKSLNTGAIWVSDHIGATKLYDYLYRFGFGESTHSGLGRRGRRASCEPTRTTAGTPPTCDQQLRPGHRRDAAAGHHRHLGL